MSRSGPSRPGRRAEQGLAVRFRRLRGILRTSAPGPWPLRHDLRVAPRPEDQDLWSVPHAHDGSTRESGRWPAGDRRYGRNDRLVVHGEPRRSGPRVRPSFAMPLPLLEPGPQSRRAAMAARKIEAIVAGSPNRPTAVPVGSEANAGDRRFRSPAGARRRSGSTTGTAPSGGSPARSSGRAFTFSATSTAMSSSRVRPARRVHFEDDVLDSCTARARRRRRGATPGRPASTPGRAGSWPGWRRRTRRALERRQPHGRADLRHLAVGADVDDLVVARRSRSCASGACSRPARRRW